MNWFFRRYKEARGAIPKMDDIDERNRNPYVSSPLVSVNPTYLGKTEKRDGYPKNISQFEEETEQSKLNQHLPGVDHENPLMEQDPPTGEGASRDVYKDDFDGDEESLPYGGLSQRIDEGNGSVGPHNMHNGIFNKIKTKTKTRIKPI